MSLLEKPSISPDLPAYNHVIIEENSPSAPPMDDEVFYTNPLPSAPPSDDETDQASTQYQLFCRNPYPSIREGLLSSTTPLFEEINLSQEDLDVASEMKATVTNQLLHKIKGNRNFHREFCELVVDCSKIQEMEIELEHLENGLKPESQAVFNLLRDLEIDFLRSELHFPFSEVDTFNMALTIFIKNILFTKIKDFVGLLKATSPEFLEKRILSDTTGDKSVQFSEDEETQFNEIKQFSVIDLVNEAIEDPHFYENFCKLLSNRAEIDTQEATISRRFETELTIEEQIVFDSLSDHIFESTKKMLSASPFDLKNASDAISIIVINKLINDIDHFSDFFRHNCPEYLQNLLIDEAVPFLREADPIHLSIEDQREVVGYQRAFVNDISIKLTKKFPDLANEILEMTRAPEIILDKESRFRDIESSLDPEFLSNFLFLTKETSNFIQSSWSPNFLRDRQEEIALTLLIKEIVIEELEVYIYSLRKICPNHLQKTALHHQVQTFKQAADQIKEEIATKKIQESFFLQQPVEEVKDEEVKEKVPETSFSIPGLATLRSIYQSLYQYLFGK